MSKELDLSKEIILDIAEKQGFKNQKAKVVLCLEYSRCMYDMYRSGLVQGFLNRVFPIVSALDDDGELDVYVFSNWARKSAVSANADNYKTFIKDFILNKAYSMNTTCYDPVMKEVSKDFFLNDKNVALEPKGKLGMFSRLLGCGETESSVADIPTLAIFLTCGNNIDKAATEETIKNLASHGIFWQFAGVMAPQSDVFEFINVAGSINRTPAHNAHFCRLLASDFFGEQSRTSFYASLLNEYPVWLKDAKTKGIIK